MKIERERNREVVIDYATTIDIRKETEEEKMKDFYTYLEKFYLLPPLSEETKILIEDYIKVRNADFEALLCKELKKKIAKYK